jgi:aminoglycoside phosphotransferase (APT) family kinase protein
LSTGIGNPRLAGLPRADESVAHYESISGRPVTGVRWWFAFALVRMGLIFQRAAVQSRLRSGKGGPLRPNAISPHLAALLKGETWAEYQSG